MHAVRERDAGLPIFDVQSMDQTVDEALFTERMLALLSAAFGLLATLLAAVGLYGVMSYTVARRTREIGIRIALGAERRTVVWLVLREVVVLVAIGLAIGVPAALGLSRLVSSQLFGLSARDPLTLMLAVAVLAIVGAAAGYLPARRAASVEPVRALRYEARSSRHERFKARRVQEHGGFKARRVQKHAGSSTGGRSTRVSGNRSALLDIATWRAATVFDLRYDLSLRIPKAVAEPFIGTTRI